MNYVEQIIRNVINECINECINEAKYGNLKLDIDGNTGVLKQMLDKYGNPMTGDGVRIETSADHFDKRMLGRKHIGKDDKAESPMNFNEGDDMSITEVEVVYTLNKLVNNKDFLRLFAETNRFVLCNKKKYSSYRVSHVMTDNAKGKSCTLWIAFEIVKGAIKGITCQKNLDRDGAEAHLYAKHALDPEYVYGTKIDKYEVITKEKGKYSSDIPFTLKSEVNFKEIPVEKEIGGETVKCVDYVVDDKTKFLKTTVVANPTFINQYKFDQERLNVQNIINNSPFKNLTSLIEWYKNNGGSGENDIVGNVIMSVIKNLCDEKYAKGYPPIYKQTQNNQKLWPKNLKEVFENYQVWIGNKTTSPKVLGIMRSQYINAISNDTSNDREFKKVSEAVSYVIKRMLNEKLR